jgi:hypothetical protein
MIAKTYGEPIAPGAVANETVSVVVGGTEYETWTQPVFNKTNLALIAELGGPVVKAMKDTPAATRQFMRNEPASIDGRVAIVAG